ncbi:MAG: cation diffusion facilitator family transporter [Lachnospiraceae bacterium]|nr:cation diffusion facilitator family transporter [Lachnospiraceae bacterium]
MIDFFAKIFIRDYEQVNNAEVRAQYGLLCGRLGIFFNLLLFAIKFLAGFLSGSISILTDAFNNLSDIGSSVVMIVGFKLSSEKPDHEHPFGHGRLEYVTGLIVSIIIILMGAELVKTSAGKIISPTDVHLNGPTSLILIASIIIKLFMYGYNKSASEKLKSQAMRGVAMDSFVDSVATSVVLLTLLVNEYTGIRLDGWCGILVALFILFSGFSSAKDTIDPLLGTGIDKEFAERIEMFVKSYDDILGVHDLLVHDYGPGRMMISLHVEVPADGDMVELHDTVDNIERKLKDALGCQTVIHMDPVVVNDKQRDDARKEIEALVKGIDEGISMHDFRMVEGPTHKKVIFDIVVPFDFRLTDDELIKEIDEKVKELPGDYYAVVDIDRPFIREQE